MVYGQVYCTICKIKGWNSGPINRPPQPKPAHVAGNGRPYQAKCYGCKKDQRSRRQSMHRSRGKRDAEFGNYTMVDIDGNDPNDEIDENLPLEVKTRVNVSRIRVAIDRIKLVF